MKIVDGWLDEAIEIDYSAKSMSRQGHKITHIVNHGTAGGASAQAIGAYFRDSEVEASSHFIIGQDGTIVQGVPLSLAAWGNGALTSGHAAYLPGNINPNLYTVSVEHVKQSTDNSDALTTIQSQKSFELIQCICDTYGVPKRAGDASGGVISHADVDPINRSRCPGAYPWSDLFAYLQSPHPQGATDMLQITDPFAATHFVATSDTGWHCKDTGMDIHDAILSYWRATGGAFRLPRSNEIYGVIAGCSYQVFEAGILVYDPAGKFDKPGFSPCYAMHLDANTPGLQHLMHLAGVTTPVQPPTLNLDDAASTLHSLLSAGDAIKAAATKVLGDLGKA